MSFYVYRNEALLYEVRCLIKAIEYINMDRDDSKDEHWRIKYVPVRNASSGQLGLPSDYRIL